jgi:hypothetical protein
VPRYMVERAFLEDADVPYGSWPRQRFVEVIACNLDRRVTWLHSYISTDPPTVFDLVEAPSPEAVRLTARVNGLPVDRIIEVTTFDPYAYRMLTEPGS